MPWSAVPDDLNPHKNPNAWKGTDTFWMRWTRGLLSFGPMAKEKWAKWRDCPAVLWLAKGQGELRLESKDGQRREKTDEYYCRILKSDLFVSRIQPFCRWHVALQWPLFVSWHIFWKSSSVQAFDAHTYKNRTIKELFCGYFGAKFDPGRPGWPVYHISAAAGGSWE